LSLPCVYYFCTIFDATKKTNSGITLFFFLVLLCSGRRVKNIVFTSGDGKNHEWFLESPQVKIMLLLS
jgi:hypothetical protein